MSKCNEIFKLKDMLVKQGIPHEFINRCRESRHFQIEYYQICFPSKENRICSIIEGEGTYGYEDDLLEIMGLLTPEEEEYNSVVGSLTAEEVFKRINDYCFGGKKS